MKKEDRQINVLLVSDLHLVNENVVKLKEYIKTKSIQPDYIFASGDFVTISAGKNNDPEEIAKANQQIKEQIELLEEISDNVIYIPGNHDPEPMFADDPTKFTEKSQNINKKYIKLADDLILLGFGGSVNNPTSDEWPYQTYDIKDYNNIVWTGYPFCDDLEHPTYDKADEDCGKNLNEAYGKVEFDEGTKIILMSHGGPFNASTSLAQWNDKIVYSGSKEMSKLLYKNRKDIICNIHGHTHAGKGYCKMRNVDVINPGALKYGDFVEATFSYNFGTEYQWKVTKADFLNLDTI